MPAPIVLRNLTPETKIVPNPPAGEPVIATRSDLRDGTRSNSGGPSEPPTYTGDWLSHSQASRAPAPLLRFTDLISGPATGLGDGLGSGVIVTIWAQGVGDTQGTGKVYFTDSQGTKREASHVYYWKRADGQLPSGPARLWYSHLMQEIAFSMPAGSVNGPGQITVEKGGLTSNTLPFTVRAGNIYHIKSTGDNGNSGSWASPWATWDGAALTAPAGSTIYFHDVDTGQMQNAGDRAIYWRNEQASSGVANQFGVVAYPGNRPQAIGRRAVEGYKVEGMVVSKFKIHSSSHRTWTQSGGFSDEITATGGPFGVQTTAQGRVIGNRITEIDGGGSTGAAGAIAGSGTYRDYVSNAKLYGNEIHDYGKPNTNKLHHTTYLTIRTDAGGNRQVEPWEWQFNFLHGNQAKFGIHQFDQNSGSGDLTGKLNIQNNVVVEQGGAGISVGATNSAAWTMDCDIDNNVLIDVGRAAAWDGVDTSTVDSAENPAINLRDGGGATSGLTGLYTVRNNSIYRWAEDASQPWGRSALGFGSGADSLSVDFSDNMARTDLDYPYVSYGDSSTEGGTDLTGSNNSFSTAVSPPSEAIVPGFDSSAVTADPQITVDGAIVIVGSASPLKGGSDITGHDIYGVPRPVSATIGAVEANS